MSTSKHPRHPTLNPRIVLAAVLAGAVALAPVSAQEPPARGPIPFETYDRDGDGRILEAEFNRARNRRIIERSQQGYPMRNFDRAPAFGDIDADGDGAIVPQELAAFRAARRGQPAQ